jgi:N-acetyl-gamma-glutamylphosphate reductase
MVNALRREEIKMTKKESLQSKVGVAGKSTLSGMDGRIRAGIIGGAGYTGGELIRLLIHHPSVEISFIHSRSNTGNLVSAVHQDLLGETDLHFSGELSREIDVLFLCVGHGEAKNF